MSLKMKQLLILVGFGLMAIIVVNVYPAYKNAYSQVIGGHFAIALSTGLYKYRLENENIIKVSNLYDSDGLYDLYWPSYDKNTKNLIFEAKSKVEKKRTSIFSIQIYNKVPNVTKIIDGRYPSISSDGELLAYYLHPNELWVLDLKNNSTKKIASDMLNRQPAVWLSNSEIMYASLSKEVKIVDLNKVQIRNTGIYDIIPSANSSSGTKVLCISHDGKQILLYLIDTNSIKLIKKAKFLTMGSSLVWLPKDEGFLFTRQTWSKVLRFNELTDLFLYKFDDNEMFLIHDVVLFGGALLEDVQ